MSNENEIKYLHDWHSVFHDSELATISSIDDISSISQECLFNRMHQIAFWLSRTLIRTDYTTGRELTDTFKEDIITVLGISNISYKFRKDIIDMSSRLFLYDACKMSNVKHLTQHAPMEENDAYTIIEECNYLFNTDPAPCVDAWIEDAYLLLSAYDYYLFYGDIDDDTRVNIINDALTIMFKLEELNPIRY